MSFAATALIAAATLPANAVPTYSSIVVYGDSLSDSGNLYTYTGYPPPPYYNGRFSNGPVAVEQLSAQLHAPLLDFAFGGATTGLGNIVDGGTPANSNGLPGMLAEFSAFNSRVPATAISTSLFVVWGGADDFEALLSSNPAPNAGAIRGAAQTAVTNIDTIVDALQAEGATSILVPNLPDLGETPEFTGYPPASAYSNDFNAALAASLPSGVTLFNTDALFDAILANPGAYGFNNTTAECIEAGAYPACSGYLFFDDIHPTTAADTILAQSFAAALTPTPEPSSLVLLGTGLAGLTQLIRRRISRR